MGVYRLVSKIRKHNPGHCKCNLKRKLLYFVNIVILQSLVCFTNKEKRILDPMFQLQESIIAWRVKFIFRFILTFIFQTSSNEILFQKMEIKVDSDEVRKMLTTFVLQLCSSINRNELCLKWIMLFRKIVDISIIFVFFALFLMSLNVIEFSIGFILISLQDITNW